MRKWLLVIAFLLAPLTVRAAAMGFATSGIWFSVDPVFAGKATKIYSVAVNNTYQRLTVTVSFTDNGTELGQTTAEIPHEDARQLNMSWAPTIGSHIIVARFVSATALGMDNITHQLSANELNQIAPPISKTVEVDGDIDNDGLGDHQEASYGTSPLIADTDGDGLSDYDEIYKYKTDPNKADTDGDGMKDGEEIRVGRNPLVSDNPPPPPAPSPAPTPPPAVPKNSAAKTSAKNSAAKTTAKTAPTTPNPTETWMPSIATSTTPLESAVSLAVAPTSSTPANISPAPTSSSPLITDNTWNWVKLLAIVAGLLAIGATTSGYLAWREQHRD